MTGDNLFDTQSKIDTKRGASFPYEFGLDFLRKMVVIYNREKNSSAAYSPADLQRLANDQSLDPHRHSLYKAAWEYWQSKQVRSSPRGTL